MNQEQIIAIAKQTIDTESKAIAHLSSLVDETFAKLLSHYLSKVAKSLSRRGINHVRKQSKRRSEDHHRR